MPMKEAGFLSRAEAECQRYGEDPWVFVRELGQNSRDAYATRIDITSRLDDNLRSFLFADNGKGMTFRHARKYLFRLYASSKDDDASAAGRYGVGFWSVLRYLPERIEVHSKCGNEAWAVALSGDLDQWEKIPCRRRTTGTTVVLKKEPAGPDEATQRRRLERAVVRYLARLRTAHRRARVLPVYLDGRRISRGFGLDSPGTLGFSAGAVEGVVGFGKRPSYQLYARGLPVTAGAYLEELEGKHIKGGEAWEREGAAPVYLLNGNNLDVVLSRQTVLRTRALRRLLEVARQRFDQLVSQTVGCTVRRSLPARAFDALFDGFRRLLQAPRWARWVMFLTMLVMAGAGLGVLMARLELFGTETEGRRRQSGETGAETLVASSVGGTARIRSVEGTVAPTGKHVPALRPGPAREVWNSTVDRPAPEPSWALSYRPSIPILFRLVSLQEYDARHGWQPASMESPWRRPPSVRSVEGAVEITLGHAGEGGTLLLPVPSGYVPVRGSARAGRKPVKLQVNSDGLVRARFTRGMASPLRYRVVPWTPGLPDLPADLPQDVYLPVELERRMDELRSLPVDERIRRVQELVRELVAYDRSESTARKYELQGENPDSGWVERVLEIGAGDCDVINGLAALLLRRAGVPARLVVGLVGRQGSALPGTHAWIEAESNGLRVLDATLEAASIARPAGEEPRAVPRGQLIRDRRPGQGLLGWLVGGAGVALVIVLLSTGGFGWRSQSRLRITADAGKRRNLLAGMAMDAIYRPGAWAEIPGLWHRPFIPCHGERLISLAQMIRLINRDRLFVGSPQNHLVDDAVRSGARVLDRSDRAFSGLFSRLANLRDLDEIVRLEPVEPMEGQASVLVAMVDDLLTRKRAGVACRAVAAEEEFLVRDVDLYPIRFRGHSPWARRFLAVNVEHPAWKELSGLYGGAPDLALCMAVDLLAAESGLLKPVASRLRRILAWRVIGVTG